MSDEYAGYDTEKVWVASAAKIGGQLRKSSFDAYNF